MPVDWPLMPGELPRHKPCERCARCVSGTTFPATREGDCWSDYLDSVIPKKKPSGEQGGAGNVEGPGDGGDKVDGDRVAAVLGARDCLDVNAEAVGELFLGEAAGSSGVADAVAD